jgi:hypothetical protein
VGLLRPAAAIMPRVKIPTAEKLRRKAEKRRETAQKKRGRPIARVLLRPSDGRYKENKKFCQVQGRPPKQRKKALAAQQARARCDADQMGSAFNALDAKMDAITKAGGTTYLTGSPDDPEFREACATWIQRRWRRFQVRKA